MPEVPLVMPKLSMTMVEGEVVGWRKQAGDPVAAGEVVCEVLTDKVDMEVEAPVGGVLDRIVAGPAATVPVGQPLAFIRTETDDLLAGLLDEPSGSGGAVPASTGRAARPVGERATPPSRRGPKPALPGARRRAGELGIRLVDVAGTGPAGAVTLTDVERAAGRTASTAADPTPGAAEPTAGAAAELTSRAEAGAVNGTPPAVSLAQPAVTPPGATPPTPASPQPGPPIEPEPLRPAPGSGVDPRFADALAARRRSVRAAVARAMTASAAIPQFTVFADLDLAALDRDRGGLGWTTLLVRAYAAVLREHPALNATWSDREPHRHHAVRVALAVDTPVGLLAPVLADPDRRPATELDGEIRRLVGRARTGRLGAAELAGATTTVSNLGGFGVTSFQALLTPPQATALSVGRVAARPVALAGGALATRVGTTVGLTVDHRVADGADAARLLADLAALTAAPARLLGGR